MFGKQPPPTGPLKRGDTVYLPARVIAICEGRATLRIDAMGPALLVLPAGAFFVAPPAGPPIVAEAACEEEEGQM